MDHGGEVPRPTTAESTDLGIAGVVQGGEAHRSTGTFQPTEAAYPNSAEFVRHVRAAVPVAVSHREPGPGVVYANIGASWRQLGPLDVVLVAPQLPGGVVPVHHNYGYSALQPRLGAGRGVVLVDLFHGGAGAVYNGSYMLLPSPGAGHSEVLVNRLPDGAGVVYSNYMWQPSPAAGHGEVLVGLLPDGAGHVEAFVGQLQRGSGAVYGDYGYFALLPRPGAGHGEVLVDLLPDGAEHGEVFVDLLPCGGGAAQDDYIVGMVFGNLGNFVQQTLIATARAHGMAGALRARNLGAGYDGSVALADDLGAVYDNRSMVAEHLRRLLPFAGIGACSVAVNGLAAPA